MYCPNCGANIGEQPYCCHCGKDRHSDLSRAGGAFQGRNPAYPPTAKRETVKAWKIALIACTAFVSAGLILLSLGRIHAVYGVTSDGGATADVGGALPTGAFRTEDPPSLDPEKEKAAYIRSCRSISFAALARNPDSYQGNALKITGKVIQVIESADGTDVDLRVNMTYEEYGGYGGWKDTVYVTVDLPKGADRILEDDILTIYGDCGGLGSYENILGQHVSLPIIHARYYTLFAY